MKKYLKHLLNDITAARAMRPPARPVADEEFLPWEIEDWMTDDEPDLKIRLTVGDRMGLRKDEFPPEDYWTDDEAAQIVAALHETFSAYNLAVDFPKKLPPKWAYRMFLVAFDRHAPDMPFGEYHLEFCDYDEETCPFGEFCGCRSLGIFGPDETKEHDGINVPFIHNYCDKWCERCTFTSRCAVFEQIENLSTEQKDASNEAFWTNLSDTLTDRKSVV